MFIPVVLPILRRVARIWKRGGAILKEWEVCKRPWLEFSLILNQFQAVCPKLEAKCLGKLGNSKLFSAQYLVISKKKKKKKVFAKIQSDFLAEIRNSKLFSAQNKVISQKKKKQKKGLHQNCGCYFVQFRKFRHLRGGCFRMGRGAIFHFSQKIGLKSTKSMRFCILHKPMGGLEPPRPPPGYATAYTDEE